MFSKNAIIRVPIRLGARNKRSKSAVQSHLDQIPGIGEKTIIKLLQTFKSVKRVSAASEAELESVVGVSKAKQIFIYLHPNS